MTEKTQQPTAAEVEDYLCDHAANHSDVERFVAGRALNALHFKNQSGYSGCPDSIKSMVESDIAAFTALRDGR